MYFTDDLTDELTGETTDTADEVRSEDQGQDDQPASEQRSVSQAPRKRRETRKPHNGKRPARADAPRPRAKARPPASEASDDDDPTDENVAATPEPDDELWERQTVMNYFGGDKPISLPTLYRGVQSGFYPAPINVGPNTVRWLGRECRAAKQRMIAKRDEPKQKLVPTGRGRPRRLPVT